MFLGRYLFTFKKLMRRVKNEEKIPDVAAVLETAGQMTAAPEQGGLV